jgi:hypothetical protein
VNAARTASPAPRSPWRVGSQGVPFPPAPRVQSHHFSRSTVPSRDIAEARQHRGEQKEILQGLKREMVEAQNLMLHSSCQIARLCQEFQGIIPECHSVPRPQTPAQAAVKSNMGKDGFGCPQPHRPDLQFGVSTPRSIAVPAEIKPVATLGEIKLDCRISNGCPQLHCPALSESQRQSGRNSEPLQLTPAKAPAVSQQSTPPLAPPESSFSGSPEPALESQLHGASPCGTVAEHMACSPPHGNHTLEVAPFSPACLTNEVSDPLLAAALEDAVTSARMVRDAASAGMSLFPPPPTRLF